jgi:hypothetical protein
MSNLFPDSTGINYTLWLSSKSGREKHQARIKISNSDGEASISIWGEPQIKSKKGKIVIDGKSFNAIKKFIELNKEVLMQHWNGEIDSKTFANSIKSI